MIAIATINAPPRLRGMLSIWFRQVQAGVYVGECNRSDARMVWRVVKKHIGDGSAVLAWSQEGELRIDQIGDPSYRIEDFDGMPLVTRIRTEGDKDA